MQARRSSSCSSSEGITVRDVPVLDQAGSSLQAAPRSLPSALYLCEPIFVRVVHLCKSHLCRLGMLWETPPGRCIGSGPSQTSVRQLDAFCHPGAVYSADFCVTQRSRKQFFSQYMFGAIDSRVNVNSIDQLRQAAVRTSESSFLGAGCLRQRHVALVDSVWVSCYQYAASTHTAFWMTLVLHVPGEDESEKISAAE